MAESSDPQACAEEIGEEVSDSSFALGKPTPKLALIPVTIGMLRFALNHSDQGLKQKRFMPHPDVFRPVQSKSVMISASPCSI